MSKMLTAIEKKTIWTKAGSTYSTTMHGWERIGIIMNEPKQEEVNLKGPSMFVDRQRRKSQQGDREGMVSEEGTPKE